MHSTLNIKIQLAFIINSRYIRSVAAVQTTGFLNQLYFLKLKLQKIGGGVSYRHKKHTHIHKMLISFNLFLGVLHKVQKEQFIWRIYMCSFVHLYITLCPVNSV